MASLSKESPCIFDFLDLEASCTPKQEDEVIASNLYFVSLPHSFGILSGDVNERDRNEMLKNNEWLRSVIPEAQGIFVLNFDRIKEYIPDWHDLKSCDAFFYKPNEKCFLIEFKAMTKEKLLKKLDLKTDDNDAIIKKVAHSKIFLEGVRFRQEETCDNIVARTHVVIVYGGKNTEPSPTSVHSLLPQKTRCMSNGKQMRASIQEKPSRKEIDQPTKRFADYIKEKFGFCSVTKRELPGAATPDNNPRFASFMTVRDFSNAVYALFKDWDWGDYLPYFRTTGSVSTEATEKVPELV